MKTYISTAFSFRDICLQTLELNQQFLNKYYVDDATVYTNLNDTLRMLFKSKEFCSANLEGRFIKIQLAKNLNFNI